VAKEQTVLSATDVVPNSLAGEFRKTINLKDGNSKNIQKTIYLNN